MSGPDNLSLVVDLLILLTVTVFYTGFFVWFNFLRQDLDRAETALRQGGALMGLFGLVFAALSLWGEMTFPLFGSYNTFFFDPLVMLSVLMIAFGAAVWFRLPTHFVGILGVVVGSGTIYYGARAYQLGLTQDPFETFLMYLAFGGVAILSFVATLFIDWFVVGPRTPSVQPIASGPKPEYPRMWMAFLGLFMAVVLLAGIAAVLYGFSIAWSHL